MDGTGTRRCALPACEVEVSDIPGRPPRRYCSPAHRGAARQARRRATRAEEQQRLVDALPWVADDEPGAGDAAAPADALGAGLLDEANRVEAAHPEADGPDRAPEGRGNGRAPASRRWRRLIAALGLAAAVVAGLLLVPTAPAPSPAVPTPSAAAEQDWAGRAQLALASIDEQLGTIGRAEDAWNRLRDGDRAAPPPADALGSAEAASDTAVRALLDRKAVLEARQATLASQLDLYRSLGPLRADLAAARRHLDAVQVVLDRTQQTAGGRGSVLVALREQRDLRLRRLEAKQAELRAAEADVEAAAGRPLPDDAPRTTQLADAVLGVVDDELPVRSPGSAALPARADAVNGRRPAPRERADTPTGAPPDPRDGTPARPGPRRSRRRTGGPRPTCGATPARPRAWHARSGADRRYRADP